MLSHGSLRFIWLTRISSLAHWRRFRKRGGPFHYWRVTDPEAYVRAIAGEATRANARIGELAAHLVRDRVARLSVKEVRRLVDAGGAELRVDDGPEPDALLGDVLEELNAGIRALGIEITTWRVEVVAQPAT